jgi:hypothetical protein
MAKTNTLQELRPFITAQNIFEKKNNIIPDYKTI